MCQRRSLAYQEKKGIRAYEEKTAYDIIYKSGHDWINGSIFVENEIYYQQTDQK